MPTISLGTLKAANTLLSLSTAIHRLNPTSTYKYHNKTQSPGSTRLEDLPIELQIQIWELTLPGPRIILTYYDNINGEFRSSTKRPAHLSLSPESRAAALRHYHLSFGITGPGEIYIDFDIDTVLLACDRDTRLAFPRFLASANGVDGLKSFAICRGFFTMWRYVDRSRLTRSLVEFIVSDGCWDPHGHRNLRWDFQEQDEEPQDASDREINQIVTDFGVWPICGVLLGAVEHHSHRHGYGGYWP